MRLHITMGDDIVRDLDERVGPRQRSGFIAEAVRQALDNEQRWEAIESAIGSIPDRGHDWDRDPAEWVRAQRTSKQSRVG